ncbi:lipopolysaccharide heptosyltransferase I [Rivibacter subsaxonicus]|uniref:Lipopolysaccharide heptosyltransferase 1 n=1 Tax=Rivibacter subsaxonicus TaxID=457575 RepID=A0A4Q7W236_9BURK|nr:lipopolysaccharide heptosyltransferase I [Rivibacter subsaxonicus]RZU03048.1 heptosyltransferase-1 [Rivibacter subsaxonicus]
MRVLIVRLSSLGDVVHAAPVVADIHAALPGTTIDWVAEEAFVPLARCIAGVDRVVPVALRRWRKQWRASREERRAALAELQSERYDAVIDLQGLIKSALVARLARVRAGGVRAGLANRTDGSAYEPLARWAYSQAVAMPPRIHVVERSRRLAAAALAYAPQGMPRIDWTPPALPADDVAWADPRAVWLVHGSAKTVKLLDETFWATIATALVAEGWRVMLPWGTDEERARSQLIGALADAGEAVRVPPRLPLDRLTSVLQQSAGSIGLDTGLSHLSATLGRPSVQLFLEDKAWRAAIDWMPRTRALQATAAIPITPEFALSAWREVAAG